MDDSLSWPQPEKNRPPSHAPSALPTLPERLVVNRAASLVKPQIKSFGRLCALSLSEFFITKKNQLPSGDVCEPNYAH